MSKSNLPNGGYTLTQGSNYMLDGFHFDTEYNGGVEDRARLPEAKGLSSLPSGMIPMGSEGHTSLPDGVEMEHDLNLDELTKDASQDIHLVDHSWLASEPKPNLEGEKRLEAIYADLERGQSESPESQMVIELQDAWGSTSTDGISIVPNSARDQKPVKQEDNLSSVPGDKKALYRKLAYGEPLKDVLMASGLEGDALLNMKSKMAAEYGLHGRVYIKEEYFPGLFNGRWDEVINKRCATAMYIIPKSPDCAYDRFLGMQVVNKVPYKKAAKALLPKLDSYGVKIASDLDSKGQLKKAFIDIIEGRIQRASSSPTWFQTHTDNSDLISLDHARRVLEASEQELEVVPSCEEVEAAKGEKKLARIASKLIKGGFLEAEQVEAVVALNTPVEARIERLHKLATMPKEKAHFNTFGKEASLHNMTQYGGDADPHAKFDSKTQRLNAIEAKRAQDKVANLVKAGLVTISEVEKVAKGRTAAEKVQAVLKYASKKNKGYKVAQYQGQVDMFEHRSSSEDLAQQQQAHFEQLEAQSKKAYQKEVLTEINRMVQSGVVSMEQFEGIVKKHASLDARLNALTQLINKPLHSKKASGQTAHYGTQATKEIEIKHTEADWVKAKERVAKLVETGLLTQDQVNTIKTKNPDTFIRKAFDMAASPEDVTTYQGAETAHVLGNNKQAEALNETEIKVATWVRQKMSEGEVGESLDALISLRFNANVRQANQDRIASLREAHEGLSGHAYVDSEAYPNCDKGALIHRANTIPSVLKSAKCQSCVFNSQGSCQKYAKVLVASPDEIVEDVNEYKKKMIWASKANDAELTADMFNNYDPQEFSLTSAEEISLEEAPTTETLGEVLFGGFEV
jgi:hypothetical protein